MYTILNSIKKHIYIPLLSALFLFQGCTHTQIASHSQLPVIENSETIALYALENYTDTPRAGMRAANIAEGVLLAKGYQVRNRITESTRRMSLEEKISDAKKYHTDYLFAGGVSEWRYKTGIDGEPAISLHFKLIDVHTRRVVWSSVGSDNSWGNASIGTVSQELITSMLLRKTI